MQLFDRLFGVMNSPSKETDRAASEPDTINPATGLPTVGGVGSPDIAGNPYGLNLAQRHEQYWDRHDRWATDSSFNDHARWHDSWSSSNIGGEHDPWRD